MKFFWSHKKKSRNDNPFLIQEGRILNESVKEISRKRWVEETWITDNKKSQSVELSEFIGVAANIKKIKLIGCFIFLIVGVIFLRNVFLQIWQGKDFRAQAEDNRLRVKPIIAERGVIYDRNNIPLVTNVPSFNLVLSPQDLPKNEENLNKTLEKISNLSGISILDLKAKLNNSGKTLQAINLIENLDYGKAMSLILSGAEIPGITMEQTYNRFYLYSSENTSSTLKNGDATIYSLAHLLGYTGKINKNELQNNSNYLLTDFIGKTGLEKQYEKELRGVYGEKAIEVDALGKGKNVVKVAAPKVGKNLILTINLEYQKKLEEFLLKELQAINKKKAVAILLDPNNGEILALVNLPAFDNNLFVRGISADEYKNLINDENNPLFARAWSGLYPSGSTIKPLFAAAALNEKIVDKNTTILSNGGIQVDRWFFPDWKSGGHGSTDVRKALAESVNTFFYYIGGGYNNFVGLGLDKLIIYLKKFNFGSTLGIDLPEEAKGFIPSRQWKLDTKKEKWFIGDTYNLSIGQGDLLVTPLQIASLTATIANGGTIYQPHILKSLVDPADNASQETKITKLQEKVIPDNYLKIIREGMRQTVTQGSARALSNLEIAVAGKTGTAQWSAKADNHAWFTSFVPFDKPQLVLTVLIEEGGEGSGVAVPVAKDFFSWYEKNH
ncbi:MAG TPA: penicillin-binding protein 2 [Candidatus Magasanikbacteria bacterium]|nr:penicillin-binding protein 2 [Candidatus Magasanikbacteria bacterium]